MYDEELTYDASKAASPGVHDKCDDESVKTQDFGENEDKDLCQTYQPRLSW